jgi:hypothetical protein
MLEEDFFITCLVNIIGILVSATGHCCVPSWFSHPRGTLASRGRAVQTTNDVTRVRAAGLTSSAAPVWTEVRSCGLKTQTLLYRDYSFRTDIKDTFINVSHLINASYV